MPRSQRLQTYRDVHLTIYAAVAIAALIGSGPGNAAGAPEVRGTTAAMQLQAHDVSIRHVLDELARAFKLTYQLPPSVNRVVSGRYSGSLRQVLARILDGHSYIIREMEDGAEIVVLGTAGVTTIADPASAPVSVPIPNHPVATDVQKPVAEAASPPLKPLSSFR